MEIRKATKHDLDRIMKIFEDAKTFMRRSGNLTQWGGGYPQRRLMEEETEHGHCYVCCDGNGTVAATFCLLPGPDPTYAHIYDGQWIDNRTYHVLHRLASDGSIKGAGRFCLEWCIERCPNLRVDTHADNLPMQKLLASHSFVRCGKIRVEDGSWRIAYQHQ